jgi:short-subunit dehydrogenase
MGRTHPELRWARALVTGGSAGIGAAFARELAAAGTDLVLVARGEERLKSVASDLERRHGITVETITADLLNRDEVAEVERRLEAAEWPVDLMINNVGGHYGAAGIAPFADHDRADLEAEAWLNAIVLMRLTHAAVRPMLTRGRGDIIQVSAGVAFAPAAGSANYAATKAYVNSLTTAVDHELRGTGIRLTAICPGFTNTDGPRRIGFSVDNVPTFMWKEPDEVARVAIRAASHGRRAIYSPGLLAKILGRLSYYGPRPIVLRVMGGVMSDRRSAGSGPPIAT